MERLEVYNVNPLVNNNDLTDWENDDEMSIQWDEEASLKLPIRAWQLKKKAEDIPINSVIYPRASHPENILKRRRESEQHQAANSVSQINEHATKQYKIESKNDSQSLLKMAVGMIKGEEYDDEEKDLFLCEMLFGQQSGTEPSLWDEIMSEIYKEQLSSILEELKLEQDSHFFHSFFETRGRKQSASIFEISKTISVQPDQATTSISLDFESSANQQISNSNYFNLGDQSIQSEIGSQWGLDNPHKSSGIIQDSGISSNDKLEGEENLQLDNSILHLDFENLNDLESLQFINYNIV